MNQSNSNLLQLIPHCKIDPHGVFKYIQIKVVDQSQKEEKPSKIVIRGYLRHQFHSDNFADFQNELMEFVPDPQMIHSDCLGGGRININKDTKEILVYGYSQAYGQCDHKITCDILREYFDDYKIDYSNSGY